MCQQQYCWRLECKVATIAISDCDCRKNKQRHVLIRRLPIIQQDWEICQSNSGFGVWQNSCFMNQRASFANWLHELLCEPLFISVTRSPGVCELVRERSRTPSSSLCELFAGTDRQMCTPQPLFPPRRPPTNHHQMSTSHHSHLHAAMPHLFVKHDYCWWLNNMILYICLKLVWNCGMPTSALCLLLWFTI
jgi:hypothetical protein